VEDLTLEEEEPEESLNQERLIMMKRLQEIKICTEIENLE